MAQAAQSEPAGQPAERRVAARQALELNPDYAEVWYALKTTYEGQKKFQAAVEALGKGVALRPDLNTA